MAKSSDPLLLTCEHAGNQVPLAYRSRFDSDQAQAALASHRGFDPGALALARGLAVRLGTPLYALTTTRLLVEPNRSIGHPMLLSEFTADLSPEQRSRLLDRYYHPHRRRVERVISRRIARGYRVIHVGVHSFNPTWRGVPRSADAGLLYDPARTRERHFCDRWQQHLRSLRPHLRVRRNYPYRGVSDGFVTYLRTRFGPRAYVGIELEVSQRLIASAGPERRRAITWFAQSLGRTLAEQRDWSVRVPGGISQAPLRKPR